jgi:hypothetical protein
MAVALAANVVVLIDELAASVVAMRILREDGRLAPGQLGSGRGLLVAAFATYAAGFAGQSFALSMVGRLNEMAVGRHFEPAAPLVGTWAWVAVALAVAVAGACGLALLRFVLGGDPPRDLEAVRRRKSVEDAGDLVRGGLVLALLWLVWDQPLDPAHPFLCIVALLGARDALALALAPASVCLALPLALVLIPLYAAIHLITERWGTVERDARFARDRAQAEDGAAPAFARVALAAHRSPSWTTRAARLVELAAPIPFAVWVLGS